MDFIPIVLRAVVVVGIAVVRLCPRVVIKLFHVRLQDNGGFGGGSACGGAAGDGSERRDRKSDDVLVEHTPVVEWVVDGDIFARGKELSEGAAGLLIGALMMELSASEVSPTFSPCMQVLDRFGCEIWGVVEWVVWDLQRACGGDETRRAFRGGIRGQDVVGAHRGARRGTVHGDLAQRTGHRLLYLTLVSQKFVDGGVVQLFHPTVHLLCVIGRHGRDSRTQLVVHDVPLPLRARRRRI